MENRRTAVPCCLILIILLCSPSWAQEYFSGTDEIQQRLEQVQVLGSALMIAAHPDDENTAVLAWLARGRHVRTGYLSLTRGEGGQNLLGSEQGDALGVIRTQELLAARKIDGAEQFFTRAIDFGFSKSPKEAIGKWGHDEILSDMVWVIRRFQPDVIILRFSGTPRDGHGHHQASAILGREAFTAAGDATRFPEQLRWVKPWHAKRLVWNAFSFTPEQEKETAAMAHKVEVDAGAFDAVLGKSYGEIAGMSRSQHRSQGMGVAQQRGPSLSYFTPVDGEVAEGDLFDGIDTRWSRVTEGSAIRDLLARAQREFSPRHPELIAPMLLEARTKIASLSDKGNMRAKQKLAEVDRLLELTAGLWIDAVCDRAAAFPGDSVKVTLTVIRRIAGAATWRSSRVSGAGANEEQHVDATLAGNQPVKKEVSVSIPASAPYSQPFWLTEPHPDNCYLIRDPELIGRPDPLPVLTAEFELEVAGAQIRVERPVQFRYVDHVRGELTRPLEIVPPVSVGMPERAVVFPNGEERRVPVRIQANAGAIRGKLRLEVPTGWTVTEPETAFEFASSAGQQDFAFAVKPPAGVNPGGTDQGGRETRGQFRAVATVNGQTVGIGMQPIAYEHIPPQTLFVPSSGVLQSLPLRVLARNIGYVMGAGDTVPDAIRQMGCVVTMLDSNDLLRGELSRFDAIVTGVRAYNVRDDLKTAEPRLLDYVQGGGTLVVQYNVLEFAGFGGKPIQPGPLGPYSLELSRDRITDENSPVTPVVPESPLLKAPNSIGPRDFEGWIQERGLYFANKWDPRYSTVIATHDEGEKDLPGGMLFAKYGKGAFVFTAYSWFRELPAGVPGAYRLFANLLSAGKANPAPTESHGN